MLGKLIKYDLLYNWRFFVGTVAALLLWGAIGFPSNAPVAVTLTAVLTPVILALMVLCVVSVLRYYNQSMYGQQGYLTMALPASPAAILGAKVLTAVIWYNVILAAAALAVAFLSRDVAGLFEMIFYDFGSTFLLWLQANVFMLFTLSSIYLAITVANVSIRGRRLGAWGGIGCYLLWMLLYNILSELYTFLLAKLLHASYSWSSALFETYVFGVYFSTRYFWLYILFYSVLIAAALLLNLWLVRKKVNLQ